MDAYARGIPTYKGKNGQTIGLLCETKEQCITDDDGVRLSDKLLSIRQQIDEGPDFTGLATEDYVDTAVSSLASKEYVNTSVSGLTNQAYVANAISGLATKTYVDNAVDGLATESYVSNAVKDLATKEELEESAGNQATQTALNNHTSNSTVHITASERTTWNAKVSQTELQEATGSKVDQTTYNSHANNATAHVTAAERTSWNAKVDADELAETVESIENDIANIVNGTSKVGKASQADSATNATKATTADSATKATSDGAGNNIVATYSTKIEVESILAGLESGETSTGNAAALGGETSTEWQTKIDAKVPNTRTVNGKALSANISLSASDVGADAKGSANSALTSAKAYTDTETTSALTDAKEYADTVASTTLTSAKSYTDTSTASTLKSAKSYTDAEVTTLETAIGKKANQSSLDTHTGNTTVHITAAERMVWNGKVSQDELQEVIDGITDGTTVAAKATDANTLDGKDSTYFATATSVTNITNGTTKVAKATAADSATKATQDASGNNIASTYATKSDHNTHTGNTTVHVTAAERTAWNSKVSTEQLQTAISGITSGQTMAGNADTVDGYHASAFLRILEDASYKTRDELAASIPPRGEIRTVAYPEAWPDFEFPEGIVSAGYYYLSAVKPTVEEYYVKITLIYLTTNEEWECSKCFGFSGWTAWKKKATNVVVIATDPGVGASVSYANGTLLFVKGA